MKKAIQIPCFVLALSVSHYAEAQTQTAGPSVEKAAQEYRQHEEALAKLQKAVREKSADGKTADGEQTRDELRQLVKKSFDTRQKLRYAQVKALQQRLHDIELAIGKSQANEEAIIDARVDDLLSGKEVAGQPRYPLGVLQYVPHTQVTKDGKTITTYAPPVPGLAPYPGATGPALPTPAPIMGTRGPIAVPGTTFQMRKEPHAEQLTAAWDIDTREQLAKLDAHAAEQELASVRKELSSLQELEKEGGASDRQMRAAKHRQQQAEIELERAKIKIAVFAQERTNLIAAAEAEVDEAEAARHKAHAQRQTSIAQVETAEAEIAKAEADLTSAQSASIFCKKQYERVKQLAAANAVDEKLLDEKEKELSVANGALESTRAEVTIAKTNARRAKSVHEESQADLELAEARLRAAKARRDRLAGEAKTSQSASQANPAASVDQ